MTNTNLILCNRWRKWVLENVMKASILVERGRRRMREAQTRACGVAELSPPFLHQLSIFTNTVSFSFSTYRPLCPVVRLLLQLQPLLSCRSEGSFRKGTRLAKGAT